MTTEEKEVILILNGWIKELPGLPSSRICEWIDPKRPMYIFDLDEAYEKVCQYDRQ